MPATILTSLLIWSALLLPGVKELPTEGSSSSLASCRSTALAPVHPLTIQAMPVAGSESWLPSEATCEEEESSDNDDNVVVAERLWTLARLTLDGQTSTLRPERGFVLSPNRCSILRC